MINQHINVNCEEEWGNSEETTSGVVADCIYKRQAIAIGEELEHGSSSDLKMDDKRSFHICASINNNYAMTRQKGASVSQDICKVQVSTISRIKIKN
ncbi:hypothetical protein EWB00_008436 [Schistosoma japonicum]|uniref:Uncharacterized protein n=1 Tax=Schistosoma japonicum TaxID=6182 RepID=A0A4Z2CPZ5_SCHJA|nr:hypothetical protein EWB00_008436 [Schistosoma japonicum]